MTPIGLPEKSTNAAAVAAILSPIRDARGNRACHRQLRSSTDNSESFGIVLAMVSKLLSRQT